MEQHHDALALQLIESCIDLSPAAREAVLTTADRERPEVARRARALLAREEQATGVMGTGATGLWQEAARPLPERIGSWRITGRIGDGGMGIVLRGERDDGLFEQDSIN